MANEPVIFYSRTNNAPIVFYSHRAFDIRLQINHIPSLVTTYSLVADLEETPNYVASYDNSIIAMDQTSDNSAPLGLAFTTVVA